MEYYKSTVYVTDYFATAFTRQQYVQCSIVVQLGDNYIPELAMHLEIARVVETVYYS